MTGEKCMGGGDTEWVPVAGWGREAAGMSETTWLAPTAAKPVGASRRSWLRHFVEMLAAMVVGMALLDPLWSGIVGNRPDAQVPAMAVDMAIGMGVWMAYRGHARRQIVEMAAAMVVPYAVLLVPTGSAGCRARAWRWAGIRR